MDVLAPAVERLLINHWAGFFRRPGEPPKNITIL